MINFNNHSLNFAEYLLDLINQIVSDEKEFIATIDVPEDLTLQIGNDHLNPM